jgi:hypothetical protein
MTETVTFELPLKADDTDLTVDALFTALDHAKAYHDHEGQYADLYNRLEQELYEQGSDQIDTS